MCNAEAAGSHNRRYQGDWITYMQAFVGFSGAEGGDIVVKSNKTRAIEPVVNPSRL
jgi:hypothetical protein